MLKKIKCKMFPYIYILIILMTILNLFILWNLKCIVIIPFSLPTVVFSAMFIKLDIIAPIYICIYIVVIFLVYILSFIDIIKFKKRIIFPYISLVLLICNFIHILFVNFQYDSIVFCISVILFLISEFISILIMLSCISEKRKLMKFYKENIM